MNELGECYICTLEFAPLSPCNCKNMYLHYNCQIKLIHENDDKCSVCLEKFNNVEVITKVKYYYSFQTKITFYMLFFNFLLTGTAIYEFFLYFYLNKNNIIIFISGNLLLAFSLIIITLVYIRIINLRASGNFYIIKNERIINLKL